MRYGCVLAGGQSRRMGRDKVLLAVDGRPLVARALGVLREAGCEAVIAGARPELAEYAPVIADRVAGAGPLAGIAAVLEHYAEGGEGPVVFVAVDLPLMPATFLRALMGRAERTRAMVTVPFVGGTPQPLCAVYRTELRGALGEALAAGDGKIMRVMRAAAAGAGECDFFRVEALAAAGALPPGTHRWFTNLNAPADLGRLPSASLDVR